MKGKKIKCMVRLHGIRREINWGPFESKAQAKRALLHWNRPYTIVPLNIQTKQ